MNLFEAIILGLVQGITEFIPVSSSGHLEIVQYFLGGRSLDFHLFLELINIGTLLALLIFFRQKIITIFHQIFQKRDFKLASNLLITAIPAGLIGFLLSDFIESQAFFSSIITISIAIGLVGVLMILVDYFPKLSTVKSLSDLSSKRALIIGLAQVFALIPGTSRSGSTIVAGRLVGFDSKLATEYSFLASIPIMLGVCLKTFVSSSSRNYFFANFPLLLLSNSVAFISGLIAVSFLMRLLRRPDTLKYLGLYRVLLASIVLILVFFIRI